MHRIFMIFALLFAVNQSIAQSYVPKPQNLPKTCIASNITELQSCVSKLRNISYGVDNIKITNILFCNQPNQCRIDLSGLNEANRIVTIYGLGRNSNGTHLSGFMRSAEYGHSLIDIKGSKNIIIRDLVFDEDVTDVAWQSSPAPIYVGDAQNILVDSVDIFNAKFSGIQIVKSSFINIRNSKIDKSHLFGIWISAAYVSSNVKIENNLISDSRANGIYFSGTNGVISGNEFKNNHNQMVFQYPGGQVLLENPTNNLVVQRNKIHSGYLPNGNQVSGIEMAKDGIYNVDISNNYIYNNNGAGVAINPNNFLMDNIVIKENQIYNNLAAMVWYSGGYTPVVINNCNTASAGCVPSMPIGSFAGTPSSCIAAPTTCTALIQWNSTNNISPKVTVDLPHTLLSVNASDSAVVPWISKTGGFFELYSGNVLLATHWIIAN